MNFVYPQILGIEQHAFSLSEYVVQRALEQNGSRHFL